MSLEVQVFSEAAQERFLERVRQPGFFGELIFVVNDGKITNIHMNTKHIPKKGVTPRVTNAG